METPGDRVEDAVEDAKEAVADKVDETLHAVDEKYHEVDEAHHDEDVQEEPLPSAPVQSGPEPEEEE